MNAPLILERVLGRVGTKEIHKTRVAKGNFLAVERGRGTISRKGGVAGEVGGRAGMVRGRALAQPQFYLPPPPSKAPHPIHSQEMPPLVACRHNRGASAPLEGGAQMAVKQPLRSWAGGERPQTTTTPAQRNRLLWGSRGLPSPCRHPCHQPCLNQCHHPCHRPCHSPSPKGPWTFFLGGGRWVTG